MYKRNPSLGGGTPVIQILKLDACYSKSLEDVICKVKKETASPTVARRPRRQYIP